MTDTDRRGLLRRGLLWLAGTGALITGGRSARAADGDAVIQGSPILPNQSSSTTFVHSDLPGASIPAVRIRNPFSDNGVGRGLRVKGGEGPSISFPDNAAAITTRAGSSTGTAIGRSGLVTSGGNSDAGSAGDGLVTTGGNSSSFQAGAGAVLEGGSAAAGTGGPGLQAVGWYSLQGPGGPAGPGLLATGQSNAGGSGLAAAGLVSAGGFAISGVGTPGIGLVGYGGRPRGDSVQGVGVMGVGGAVGGQQGVGVSGVSDGPWPGALGINQSTGPGVLGQSSSTAEAVSGASATQAGGQFHGGSGPGLSSTAPGAGVVGKSNNGTGIVGISQSGYGVLGATTQPACVGISDQGAGGFFQSDTLAQAALRAENAQATDPAGNGSLGMVINGELAVQNGLKAVVVPTSRGLRTLVCREATVVTFEDFGTAQLRRGSARVDLDPLFAEIIDTSSYFVLATPRGDSHPIAVVDQDTRGFTLLEQPTGTSSIAVDYQIVGQKKGLGPEHRLAVARVPHFPTLPKPGELKRPVRPAAPRITLPPRPEQPRLPPIPRFLDSEPGDRRDRDDDDDDDRRPGREREDD